MIVCPNDLPCSPPSEQTFLLDTLFSFLVANVRSRTSRYNLPRLGLIQVGGDFSI